jgi:hypothetical protein
MDFVFVKKIKENLMAFVSVPINFIYQKIINVFAKINILIPQLMNVNVFNIKLTMDSIV